MRLWGRFWWAYTHPATMSKKTRSNIWVNYTLHAITSVHNVSECEGGRETVSTKDI